MHNCIVITLIAKSIISIIKDLASKSIPSVSKRPIVGDNFINVQASTKNYHLHEISRT